MKNVSIYEAVYLPLSELVKLRDIASRLGKHLASNYRGKKTIRFCDIRQFVRNQRLTKRKRHRRF